MHELGIVFHVIRAVENIGREQGLTDVASVTLELGQVSGVVDARTTDKRQVGALMTRMGGGKADE